MPYAVRRGLAPTTPEGKRELRDTLLNARGEFAFENFQETIDLVQRMQQQSEEAGGEEAAAEGKEGGEQEKDIATAITGRAPVILSSLVTAPEGHTIRKIMVEADTVAFVKAVLPQISKDVQKTVASSVAENVLAPSLPLGSKAKAKAAEETKAPDVILTQSASPHTQRVLRTIAMKHFGQLLSSGPRGLWLLARLAFVGLRIAVYSMVNFLTQNLKAATSSSKNDNSSSEGEGDLQFKTA